MGWGNHHASWDSKESWDAFYKREEESAAKRRPERYDLSLEQLREDVLVRADFSMKCDCGKPATIFSDGEGGIRGQCSEYRERRRKGAAILLGFLTPVDVLRYPK